MQVLVLGAVGFIGRRIMAGLVRHGHQVVGAVRDPESARRQFPQAHFIACNLARDLSPADWAARLKGIDVVINAAGALRGPEIQAVHVDGPAALYQACRTSAVKRVILVSAISARPDVATDYAASKLAGERILQDSGLDYVILRPSLIYGSGSYGGTSLLRGLAALPFVLPVPGHGLYAFSPLHADDLAEAICRLVAAPEISERVLEPCGPEQLSLLTLLQRYRTWLGLPEALPLQVPLSAMNLLAWIGDRFGQGPISSNSLRQLLAGNTGNGYHFAQAIGFSPRRLDQALSEQPADVQDRWHARLFFAPLLCKLSLIVMWFFSGLAGIIDGGTITPLFAQRAGLPLPLADGLAMACSFLDFLVIGAILFDPRGRYATWLQLAVITGYTVGLTLLMPELWRDPFGPLLKNLPILALVAVNGVLSDPR